MRSLSHTPSTTTTYTFECWIPRKPPVGTPTAILLVALRVNDVDAALKTLNATGVKTAAEPKDLPALRYAFVQDPNGIRVEIVKRILTP